MQLNPRQVVVQFAHILQQDLFPRIARSVGPLSAEMELLGAVMALSPLERMIGARRSATGRPARDRAALATAFMAKAVLNLPTTRDLISRLRVDEALRQFCGWASERAGAARIEVFHARSLSLPRARYRSSYRRR